MAKFGQFKFSEAQFGEKDVPSKTRNRMFATTKLGNEVRRDKDRKVIYRVRGGKNFYGTALGYKLQDKYKYVVPSSINNPEGEPGRRQWIAAVHKWKYDLTPAQKEAYNARVTSSMHMYGYNLFMREAMKGLVDMFIDRGDPAAYDFVKTDLTLDDAWHDMDLSSIVAAGAKAVLICGHLEGAAVDWKIIFRKKGNTNEINHCGMDTLRAGVERHRSCIVAVDAARVMQYKADSEAWTTLSLAVRGWWT